ncbi:MAG: 16S rRNA (adenine(1518)-N(6)/adenine(1519)-N(6))-dimethyltransferase RsmA [Clostridia bacterium]|nr:16S rRNA (adenine(1518)-N(6)/adenine(1519)-N(6))-dimethyltransferase RsmA [Clostridia bacterium]
MNLEQETKYILNKYNAHANKGYGQNFLIDQNVVDGIIENAGVCKDDLIIEIGPGLGNLTSPLLENAGKVICIELDPKMVSILKDRFSLYENFELINDDVLKVDLNKIIEENCKFKSAKVVANLPYYITTPIIMKLLEDKLNLESITVMVQKEVAERLADKPGGKEVGAITYSINYYTNPEIIIDVPRDSFIPAPNVDSAVIKLDVLKEPKVNVLDEELFFKVIKFSFLQKRKTLINSLSNSGLLPKDFLEEILNKLGIDSRVRAEQLSLEQFGQIADHIKNNDY